jgi:hypothetical protein
MFRDRILEWSHILSPFTKTQSNLTSLAKDCIAAHAISSSKEMSVDQYRAEFYLNVSRAYIKLNQVAR